MSAVVDGSSSDVEPGQFEVAIAGGHDADPPSPAPGTQSASGRSNRNRGIGIIKTLKRLWIPLVIGLVIAAGATTVSRLHGIFGSEKPLTYADSTQEDTKAFNPKHMRYEIFGPPGTVADISYFDVHGDPVHASGVSLPWSLEFPINAAAGIGSIAAEGDGESLGCRILIDGVVKDEKTATHEVSTFVSCILKAA